MKQFFLDFLFLNFFLSPILLIFLHVLIVWFPNLSNFFYIEILLIISWIYFSAIILFLGYLFIRKLIKSLISYMYEQREKELTKKIKKSNEIEEKNYGSKNDRN